MAESPRDISTDLDFDASGRQIGEIRIVYSDDTRPAGYYSIPASVLKGSDGPTMLLTGGVHGDEFVGPAALFCLLEAIDVAALCGRLIVLPALNMPAVSAGSRCSPVDNGNLNRSFIKSGVTTLTSMIASYVDTQLLPIADAAIDIHSGGSTHTYAPVSMVYLGARSADKTSIAIAEAFGCGYLWVAEFDEDSTLNAAALRRDVPMFAVELGGRLDSTMVKHALSGIRSVLDNLGMYDENSKPPDPPRPMRITVPATGCIDAKRSGFFVPSVMPSQPVCEGDEIGSVFSIDEPTRDAERVTSNNQGLVLMLTNKGVVDRGDRLAIIATGT